MYVPQDNVKHPLYVVAVVFNPVRFKRRWKLYRDFQKMVRDAGAILLTIEATFGDREYSLEDHAPPAEIPDHIDYRSHGPAPVPPSATMPSSRKFQDYIKIRVEQNQEVWLKENLLNVACHHLPEDAKYIAFIDADVHFVRTDWVSETLHALQHYHVVQMFSVAIQMDAMYEPMQASYGYGYCYSQGVGSSNCDGDYYLPAKKWHGRANLWHTGFAWAWRRSALDAVGGLIEHGILGAGDNHMSRALVGRAEESLNPKLSESYKRLVRNWQRRCEEHIKRNVGFIHGTIFHYYHGRLFNRRYQDRWKILLKHDFDPDHDLKKDWRGIIALTDTKPALRDEVRKYFRARDEDSTDVYPGDGRLLGPSPAGIFTP